MTTLETITKPDFERSVAILETITKPDFERSVTILETITKPDFGNLSNIPAEATQGTIVGPGSATFSHVKITA